MSDLNEDLLNYELGEELDDPTLADEDELLLSDEELEKDVSTEQKAILKDEAEKWISSKLKARRTSNKENTKKIDDVVTTSSYSEESSTKRNVNNLKRNANVQSQAESDVSTSEELPPPPVKKQQIEDEDDDNDKTLQESSENDREQTKNDEVTSTNKEIEDQLVSQTIDKPVIQQAKKEELIQSLQENSVAVEGQEIFSDPREDLEERGERTNIKHTNERDEHNESPEKYSPGKFFLSKRGRGGSIMRGVHFPGSRAPVRYPHLQYPSYTPQPNENSNPQSQFPYQPVDPQLGPRQPFLAPNQIPPRMEFRPPVGQNYRPQNPNEFMYRGPRPDYASQVNGAPYYGPPLPVRPVFRQDGNVAMTSQGPIRHRMPLPPRPPGIPPQNQIQGYLMPPTTSSQPRPIPNTNHPGNFTILANVQNPAQGGGTQPVIPRKVLINPNFKGGVEAATNQLMKDTQFMQSISSHAIHLQSDEELLRQQEEFIKKNRMHIEKRRYERSPDRSRSRERSYSPPRRDRRGNSRERRGGSPRGRTRRSSREPENRFPKRRRSGSFERRREREKFEEEEDEETRAYRQEIEKQKAMREKILRDKEMRRRKAVEGKQVDEKTPTDEPPAKLKPIIVTESKIISLKKKQTADSATQSTNNSKSSQPHKQQAIQKTIPTAKILPEAKRSKIDQQQSQHYNVKDASTTTLNTTAMAVIKPVIKKTTSVQADIATNLDNKDDDDESFDEDLLLADTPSPPLSPPSSPPSPVIKSKSSSLSTKNSSANSNSSSISVGGGLSSSNRRVVLKSSSKASRNTVIQDQDNSMDINRKPIFDRLERKIAVNESVKRKIQRIVIKNAE